MLDAGWGEAAFVSLCAAASSCCFRGAGGWRGVTGLRGAGGCRFRGFAGMCESPRTAKAVAAFVPHYATAVHIRGSRRRVGSGLEPERSGTKTAVRQIDSRRLPEGVSDSEPNEVNRSEAKIAKGKQTTARRPKGEPSESINAAAISCCFRGFAGASVIDWDSFRSHQ
jgi:hypothetical protein